MAESADSSSLDKHKNKEGERQEGDGFEYINKTTSPRTEDDSTAKLNNEKTINKTIIEELTTKTSVESVGNETSLGETPQTTASQKITARAGLSSQKDLRQQFRHLQNQELIRRILNSTGVIPNNLVSNRSIGEEKSEKEVANETKEKDLPRVQVPLETNNQTIGTTKTTSQPQKNRGILSEGKEKDRTKQEGVRLDSLGIEKSPKNNINENGTKIEPKMQTEMSFVCSKCDEQEAERSQDSTTRRPANFMNSPRALTMSFLKTEEDSRADVESEETIFDSDQVSQPNVVGQREVKIQNTGKLKVDELSDRLQKQPNHETLDEILKLLQNQALMIPKDEQENKSVSFESPESVDESKDDSAWRQQQQQKFFMMGTRSNLREKHSRQLADMKNFYEGEIGKLRDQLDSLRGNLTNLQEAIPIKMLEATNHKLDARCNLMEEIASELKAKSQKLEHNNEELEKCCFDLRQANESLEMRCLFLQKSVQDLEEKQSEIQNKNMFLESKVLHLTQANEVTAKSCKQLEDSNTNFEKTCKELEVYNQQLEVRFRKCKEENLKLSTDVRDLQGSLQASRKSAQEFESTATSLQNEKNEWVLKVDASQKIAKEAQKIYEEVRVENNDKECVAKKLEEQMGVLTLSFENAAKAKDELERNAERDRELLKHLLTEYDALVKENQQLKASIDATNEKVEVSQDEINSLRGTITKLIQRNNNLEESLKDALSRSVKTTVDTSSPGIRKTWESPVPLKADKSKNTSLSSFESIFDGKGPMTSSPTKPNSESPNTPTSIKFEIPWEKPASTPTKQTPKRIKERSYMSSPHKQSSSKSPNNLVIKKSDLVTRFDVVFEDSTSGEEVKRSHTGRTSRAFGESPTSIFVSNSSNDVTGSSPNHLVSNAAEAALSALRAGKVMSQAEWENKDTVTKGKERKEKSIEKKRPRQVQTTDGENGDSFEKQNVVPKLERKLSSLSEEKKRLESTLSRIPVNRVTKRSLDDKAFLEKRLDEVIQDIGSVRMQLRRHHAL